MANPPPGTAWQVKADCGRGRVRKEGGGVLSSPSVGVGMRGMWTCTAASAECREKPPYDAGAGDLAEADAEGGGPWPAACRGWGGQSRGVRSWVLLPAGLSGRGAG
eukprot:CAMPEP_0173260556 /NCGR_PEP_ID=MMETSP1142-20121109/25650_1 /TAXON_ID=483371 /ORGANISM="non described non described, Strain CCMP2298" /LENGTH=105 /DNA_ID=CAMNT_0014195327 /DNA_START=561 /DNA_END=878 /DNA_ORIENTATION=-